MSREETQTAISSKNGENLKSGTNKTSLLMVGVVLILVVGAAGFFGGYGYARHQGRRQFDSAMMMGRGQNGMNGGNGFRGRPGGNGGFGQGQGQGRGGSTIGEITAMDDSSLTVKLPDGSSKIVLLSDSTTYQTTTKVDKTSLKTGITVRVIGATNSDGSLTGSDVMLNPIMPLPSH